jgi:uncharacterized protein DUF6484
MRNRSFPRVLTDSVDQPGSQELDQLLSAAMTTSPPVAPVRIDGVRLGTVVGFANAGVTPLVTYPEQPASAAQPARATVGLDAAHIGKSVVMMFEDGDPARPIIVGCLVESNDRNVAGSLDHVEVEADGQRVVVSATDRIVLRCGKASITLTKEGKVVIQGAYVSNQSSGVLRLKGGSVQIN